MRVEIRKTAVGTEYWDAKEKRIIFVPAGKEPDFEVTENPKSMLIGVDLASGPDLTIVNGESVASTMGISVDGKIIDLSNKTIKELRDYAASKEIEVPKDIKKQSDIAQYLYNNWVSDEE
ncbi:hypothetical protein [Cytobacillus praedii]|uniref:hypothetical protein n=1 Tax=Cytobacillus praedii TaxID=1742358 RepID=UPI002E1F97A8|nr:hypothetical protein [Cytobacillus praedii]